jgi:hypothetical protein
LAALRGGLFVIMSKKFLKNNLRDRKCKNCGYFQRETTSLGLHSSSWTIKFELRCTLDDKRVNGDHSCPEWKEIESKDDTLEIRFDGEI